MGNPMLQSVDERAVAHISIRCGDQFLCQIVDGDRTSASNNPESAGKDRMEVEIKNG